MVDKQNRLSVLGVTGYFEIWVSLIFWENHIDRIPSPSKNENTH